MGRFRVKIGAPVTRNFVLKAALLFSSVLFFLEKSAFKPLDNDRGIVPAEPKSIAQYCIHFFLLGLVER